MYNCTYVQNHVFVTVHEAFFFRRWKADDIASKFWTFGLNMNEYLKLHTPVVE
jgi:hypothetical protein